MNRSVFLYFIYLSAPSQNYQVFSPFTEPDGGGGGGGQAEKHNLANATAKRNYFKMVLITTISPQLCILLH